VAGTLPRLKYYSLVMKPTFPAYPCQEGSAPHSASFTIRCISIPTRQCEQNDRLSLKKAHLYCHSKYYSLAKD
jgi:hypothetical protein